MFWLLPALAGLGQGVSSAFQAGAQRDANATNLGISRENREWQQYMSNTAYQRATTDMKQAGLNPIMSVSQASTPTPNTPSMEPVNPMAGLGAGINTGLSAMDTMATVESKGAGAGLAKAQQLTEGVKQSQLANSAMESAARTETMRAELPGKAEKARFDKKQSMIDQDWIKEDNIMKRVQQGMGIGSSALDMVNPLKKVWPRDSGKPSEGWSGKSKDLFDYMGKGKRR